MGNYHLYTLNLHNIYKALLTCIPLQIEADLEASRNHLREESARVSSESTQLRQDQLKLKTESEVVAREKERLDALAKDIEHRSHEAKKLHQVHTVYTKMCQFYISSVCYLLEYCFSLGSP